MTSAGSLCTPIEAALVGRLLERPPSSARLPVGALTRAEKAAELQRLQARRAMDAAYEAELVLGLADDTPDTVDPPPDQPGAKKGSWAPDAELPGVSQFFTSELAVVLNCGRGTATTWPSGPSPTGSSCPPPGPPSPRGCSTRPARRCWPTCSV